MVEIEFQPGDISRDSGDAFRLWQPPKTKHVGGEIKIRRIRSNKLTKRGP